MAEAATMAWRQYRLERRLFWRNRSAAFFNFLLPLLFLGFIGAILHGNQHNLNVIVPGIAGMSVMSTTFTALAFNMTFLREQGVLKRIRGTPMPGISYLLGIAGNAITNTALQIAIITVAGRVLFGTGWPRDWPELLVFITAGVICFASLGVALSHAIPNFDSAPAYVNAVFLPVILVSGVFYDVANVPGFIKGIAQALPLKHLIDGLSSAMVRSHSGLGHNIDALGVIAAWAVLGVALAVRGFSWEQRRS
ncbi:MAG: ABC transporter permease [Actinomycetota bacterium]|nr:ABC transporter permease [Actinomycetota bacterium]